MAILRCARLFSCAKFRTYCALTVLLLFLLQCFLAYYFLKYIETEVNVHTREASDLELSTHGRNDREPPQSEPCTLKSKTALSAIQRANTQQCKREIASLACTLQQGNLFASRLPTYCVRDNSVPKQLLGCFLDDGETRLLSSYGVRLHSATVERCIEVCIQQSMPYSGLKNSRECYCGLAEPSRSLLVPNNYCHLSCNGNSSQVCGGKDSLTVYDTGSPSRESTKLSNPNPQDSVQLAFILTVNGRALRHVIRLLRLIYREKHTYYIHVDARQDYLFRNLLHLEERYPNIHVVRERQSTIWGGASLLDVLLSVVSQALKDEWQFVLNLSESDFPVCSIEELEHFLAANKGRTFLKSHGRQVKQFIQKQGLDRVFHQCEGRMWRVGDRKIPAGIRIDGGSDWFVLSRSFSEYATRDSSELTVGLRHFFRYTLLPAESFFHTLLLNSPMCSTYADSNLRMTLWRRSQGCLCQHKKVVDWCGCSPMVFRTSDWPQLETARSKGNIFFARKFDPSIDQSVLNKLEETVVNQTSLLSNWNSYWENVYDVADSSPPSRKALLFAAESFLRNALKLADEGNCQLSPGQLVAVTSYFRHDHYEGDLFLWDLSYPSNGHVEVWVKPLPKASILKKFSLFQVGTDFDPKEQVFRNKLGILAENSEPTLLYKWVSSSSSEVHFVWIDPYERVRAVHAVNMSDNSSVGHVNLGVNQPLQAGTWTVYAVEKRVQLAALSFMVLPVEKLRDLGVSHEQQAYWQSVLNLGTKPSQADDDWSNSFIDSALLKFYSLQDICLENIARSCGNFDPQRSCSSTEWSSYATDPKSLLVLP